MTPEQKKTNFKLAVVLGSVAVVIFLGFIIRSVVLGV